MNNCRRLTSYLMPGLTVLLFAASVRAEDLREAAMTREGSAAAVLQRHLDAFAAGDLDAVMRDYTDRSVFITPAGVLRGRTRIRRLFQALLEEFSAPGSAVTILDRYTAGPVAYITWTAQTPLQRYEMATDTLYVVNDRIEYQTFAAKTAAR